MGRSTSADCKGVRITSGPLIPVVNPLMSAESTDGIEIEAGETQSITVKRGMLPEVDQYITLTQKASQFNAGNRGDSDAQRWLQPDHHRTGGDHHHWHSRSADQSRSAGAATSSGYPKMSLCPLRLVTWDRYERV